MKLELEVRNQILGFKSRIHKFDLSAMVEGDNCSNCILCNS